MKKPMLPEILQRRTLAKTRLFTIEAVDLQFSNGNQRTYERLNAKKNAVIIVPFLDEDTIVFVREYGCGLHDYVLGLPKGLVDANESFLDAANRELQEEVGFAAADLTHLGPIYNSPSYLQSQIQCVVAKNLRPSSLPGDEPEPLEQIPIAWAEIPVLVRNGQLRDSRSLAALFMIQCAP